MDFRYPHPCSYVVQVTPKSLYPRLPVVALLGGNKLPENPQASATYSRLSLRSVMRGTECVALTREAIRV